jgi:hypothetical protein
VNWQPAPCRPTGIIIGGIQGIQVSIHTKRPLHSLYTFKKLAPIIAQLRQSVEANVSDCDIEVSGSF